MCESFPLETLIPITSFNGRDWESGEIDEHGRPEFNWLIKESFVKEGTLLEKPNYKVIPGELAVALAHREAWMMLLNSDDDVACILEDDVEPTRELIKNGLIASAATMPSDADVLLLTGPDQMFDFGSGIERPQTALDQNGRVIVAYGCSGYLITRQGAERALKATMPMSFHFPRQWWLKAFDGLGMWNTSITPLEERGKMYGVKKALVSLRKEALHSGLTPNGTKPWRVIQNQMMC